MAFREDADAANVVGCCAADRGGCNHEGEKEPASGLAGDPVQGGWGLGGHLDIFFLVWSFAGRRDRGEKVPLSVSMDGPGSGVIHPE